MKKFLNLFICALMCIGLAGCLNGSGKEKTASDMSGYELLTDGNHVFYDMNVKDLAEIMENKESAVVYLGFDNCPWCKEAVPVLNEAAKENDAQVGYINTRKKKSWKSNMDIDGYDKLVELIGDVLEYDDEGKKHLYVPFVIAIRNGEIYGYHEGTVDGHEPETARMTDEQREELKEIYTGLLKK